MDEQGEFSRLEALVERLLIRFTAVREEKKQLEAQLLQKEEELAALGAELGNLKEEKQQVLHRVSGLLQVMEKWESDADAEEATDAVSSLPLEPAAEPGMTG